MPGASKRTQEDRPSRRSQLPSFARSYRPPSSSRTVLCARSSRSAYSAPTTLAPPPDSTYLAAEGVRRWGKDGKPAAASSTVANTALPRRPRPTVFEFEISIQDGVTDAEGNRNQRQVDSDFLPSVAGEKASRAHKKIVRDFTYVLETKIPWGQASARSGMTTSVSDFNNTMGLHPEVTVLTRRPKGVSSKVTDGYLLWFGVKQRNAWEDVGP